MTYVQGALWRLVDLVQTDAAELDQFLVGLPPNWDCSTMPQWTLAPAIKTQQLQNTWHASM